MRKFVLLLGLLFGTAAHAQSFNLMGTCQEPSDHAKSIFVDVMTEARKTKHVPKTFLCRNVMVPNAYAWSFYDPFTGQPVHTIHYNPSFMAQLDVTRPGDWAQIAVFAHEVGHIVEFSGKMNNGWQPQFGFNNPWSQELFADEHAGQVLAGMGAQPSQIGDALLHLFSLHGSPTHPDTVSRLQAMHSGYAKAGGNVSQLDTPQQIAQNIFDELSRW